MRERIIPYLFLLILGACGEKDELEGVAARVKDAYLMEEELEKVMPAGVSSQDSVLWRNNYVMNWAIRELLFDKALINVSDPDKEVDRLVENYRRELMIDRYKRALLQQELDTVITESDIDEYYELNKNVYRLNEDLLRLRYMRYSLEMSDKKELRRMFRSGSEEDDEILEGRELEFFALSLNDSIWISRLEADKKLPFLKDEKKLKKNQFLEKEDSLGVYLVAIKDVLHRNDVAPKSYVVPTIRQMILHRRKLELMNEIEKNLVVDAINKKQFEQY